MKGIISVQKIVLTGVVVMTAAAVFAYCWLFLSTAGTSPASVVGNPRGAVLSAAVTLVCGVGMYFARHHKNEAGERKHE